MKQGKLFRNPDGRYAIDEWRFFTCGTVIELRIHGEWVKTSIEHDGNDYYAVGFKGITLEGLTACVD